MKEQPESNLRDTITLRPCIPEDSLFYYTVKKKTLKQYVEEIWGVWDEKFQQERHKRNFSTENTHIIQFHRNDIGILAIKEDSMVLRIHNIEILPEYQNQGIGSYLMKKILQNASDKGKAVSLQVLNSNSMAKKFYERLGFKVKMEGETHFQMNFTS